MNLGLVQAVHHENQIKGFQSRQARDSRFRDFISSTSLSLNSSNTPAPAKADFNFYPITTATPAANPHRFASTLPIDIGCVALVQKLSLTINTHHRTGSKDLKSAIDALVHVNGINLEEEDALGLGLGLRRSSGSGGGDTDEEASAERKVRAQAKSNRKIEDLEISNRSLLAINSMLESTRNRQAKEIHKENIGDDEDEEEDNNDDEDDDNNGNGPGDADDSFLRLRMLVDDMIETGKKALASTPDDFMKSGKGGAKVLTEEEVKNWRDSSSGGQDDNESKPTSRR
ncbi:hypothetical protein MPER_10860 [Moniliophthora perniciosa FA553]|nr:hypothetical protein MPER_10860 [Moniliophthora perniciosa FA553]